MKYTFGFILLIAALSVSSFEIKVSDMRRDGQMDNSFVLSTQLKEKVVLDCQSFIQGLRIGEFENAVYFMLDEQECESLQGRVRSSTRRLEKHCIDVEGDIRADYVCN